MGVSSPIVMNLTAKSFLLNSRWFYSIFQHSGIYLSR